MTPETTPSDMSLGMLLKKSVDNYSDNPAIIFDDEITDYQTLDEQSDKIAAFLASKGISKGDRVGLYAINGKNFPIAYFGIVKTGAIVVPVNILLSTNELAHIFYDAEISALIFHPLFSDNIKTLKDQINSLNFCLGMSDYDDKNADWQWSQALVCTGKVPQPSINPNEDLAAIIYTSGTTGKPKGAMLTHKNLAANTSSVKQALKLNEGDERFLLVLPMFHSFAGTVGMLMPLFYGCTLLVLPRFEPQQVANLISEQKATIFMGVPTMYTYLLHLPQEDAHKLESLRLCISGGAALPAAVLEKFEKVFNKPILEGDGPTECSPVTSVNPVDGVRKVGSIGLPIPEVEMKIIDEHGNEVANGEIGEICVKGPNIMKGYWKMPEATKEAFFGEWFRTGDLGHQDDDGYFFIVDRLKDMIIYNGINVYPRMIEEVLYQIPEIEEAAVIGEPNDVHGEIPVAYVALKQGVQLSQSEITAYCRKHLGRHEIPKRVYFLDELPKNATGKIVKRALSVRGERERGLESRFAEVSN